jgi:membrane fusion protein
VAELKLFRDAALDAKRAQWHGEIVMSHPIPVKVAVMSASILALLLVCFLTFGTYTKRVTVFGQLVPDAGIVKVYVPQAGTVVEERVTEGMQVNKGDVLFTVSTERQTALGAAQATISEQSNLQKEALGQQLDKVKQLLAVERAGLETRIRTLREEMPQLKGLIASQRSRIELAEQNLKRYDQLKGDGYVTHEQLIQKQAELLDQKSRLDSLERERITAQRNLYESQNQLSTLPLRYENQMADIRRSIAGIEQGLTESEVRRQFSIVAAESGTISAVNAHKGQWVDGSTPLASVIPNGAKLQAELYAPSRAIGFVRPGDAVYMRYQPFPYQKFGQQIGVVSQVSSGSLTSIELTRTNVFETGLSARGEPLYKIIVDLQSQSIDAYGKQQTLRAGMLLDADVMQETRRLYEWVLEPLYSLSKKL